MCLIIENMSASETTDLTKAPDCPHDHIQDQGVDRLRDIVRQRTDDDVAERFWKRVGEQIEIQEDWGELSRYSPKRPEPTIWEMVMDLRRRESLPPQDP